MKLISENIKESIFSKLDYNFEKIKSNNIEEIYSDIINYLFKYIYENKANYANAKKIWDDINLNLEEFIINKTIYSKIIDILNKKAQMKKFYLDEVSIENDPGLLKKVYAYISGNNNNNSFNCNLEESIKEKADKERDNNIDDNKIRTNDISKILDNNHKLSQEAINKVLEFLKIEINIIESRKPSIKFFIKKDGKNESLKENKGKKVKQEEFEMIDDYCEDGLYDGNIEEENYKSYLIFLDTIIEYIQKNSEKIKFPLKLILELIPLAFQQDEKDLNYKFHFFEKDKIKEIHNVSCIYYLIDNNMDEDLKEKKFRDDNVLINGIDSKNQGFLHLMEELTNPDFE